MPKLYISMGIPFSREQLRNKINARRNFVRAFPSYNLTAGVLTTPATCLLRRLAESYVDAEFAFYAFNTRGAGKVILRFYEFQIASSSFAMAKNY